jgi:hypothetical protein
MHIQSRRAAAGFACNWNRFSSAAAPDAQCVDFQYNSPLMKTFRSGLFMRIVPIVKDIGPWGDKVRKGRAEMGVLD